MFVRRDGYRSTGEFHKVRAGVAALLFGLVVSPASLDAQADPPAQLRALYDQGEKAFREGNLDEASGIFQEIVRQRPDFAEAHANLGLVSYKQGDFPRAASSFRQAVTRKPSLAKAEAFLGISEARSGRFEEAIPILEKSIENKADHDLWRQAGLVLLESYTTVGDLDKAADLVRTLLRADPSNPEVLYGAYRVYSDLGAKAVSQLVRAGPDSARLHQVTAELLENQGDYPRAAEQYRLALEKDPQLPGIHRALGVAILNVSQDEPARREAQRHFETALQAAPADFHSEYQLGELEWARARYDTAFERYQRAIEIQPHFTDGLMAVARCYDHKGDSLKALGYLREAAEIDPDNEVVYYRLAQVYRKLGRQQEADKALGEFRNLRASSSAIGKIYQQVQRKPVIEQSLEEQ